MPIELQPDHRRSISTTAQIVEKTLNEMEDILLQKYKENIATIVVESYSEKERTIMLTKIAEIRKANQELFQEFNLKRTEQSESQVLHAAAAYLWTVLMDSKSKKLRGFGKLSPNVAAKIDEHVERIVTLLDEFTRKV